MNGAFVRRALRRLARDPILTSVALVSLALGVGVNTALFGILNAVLLNPLFLPEPERLVAVYTVDAQNAGFFPTSTYNYRDYRDRATAFTQLAASANVQLSVASPGQRPQQVLGQAVTGNYFDTLQVAPSAGRMFVSEDDREHGAPVAVLSHRFWRTSLGSDPAVIGRTIEINKQSFAIVGIAADSFRGVLLTVSPDVWVPMATYARLYPGTPLVESRRWRWMSIIGRLRPEVSLAQARASMTTLAATLERMYPDVNTGRSAALVPLVDTTIDPGGRSTYVRAGWLLACAAGLVLLLVCVNVGHLQLVRARARLPEMATRLALGARRRDLVMHLLADSLLLSLIGGALGLLVSAWIQALLWSTRPAFLAQPAFDLRLDWTMLGFGLAISLLAGLLAGLAPAIHLARVDVALYLKERSSVGGGRARRRLSRWLTVSEVALSTLALVLAGFAVGSLLLAQRIDPGFQTERLAFVSFNLATGGYNEARARVYLQQLLDRVRAVPGVERVALSDRVPLNPLGSLSYTLDFEGHPIPAGGQGPTVPLSVVSPGYLQTMGLPLLRGRDLAEADDADTPPVSLVNEAMARQFWPGEDPLGKRFRTTVRPGWIQVAGIVQNSRYTSLGEDTQPHFYLALRQQYRASLNLVARTQGPPDRVVARVRDAAQQVDPQLPFTNAITGADLMQRGLWAPRMAAALLGAFGLLALTLSAVGIYGIVAYSVAQRNAEIALRLALGATRPAVTLMLARETLRLALAGVVIGAILAVATNSFVTRVFYTNGFSGPLALLTSGLVLMATACLACYLPARRVGRLDPALVLRAG
jgi:predicted permease